MIGQQGEFWVIELTATIENKGKAQHKMSAIGFDLNAMFNGDQVKSEEKWGGQINFPHRFNKGIKGFLQMNSTKIDTSKISLGQLEFVAMQLKWRNQFLEEKEVLKAISNTFPNSFKAQKNYAAHYIKQGYTEEGIVYYKKAQNIEPQN